MELADCPRDFDQLLIAQGARSDQIEERIDVATDLARRVLLELVLETVGYRIRACHRGHLAGCFAVGVKVTAAASRTTLGTAVGAFSGGVGTTGGVVGAAAGSEQRETYRGDGKNSKHGVGGERVVVHAHFAFVREEHRSLNRNVVPLERTVFPAKERLQGMNNIKNRPMNRSVALLVVGVLALAGCGGSDDSAAEPGAANGKAGQSVAETTTTEPDVCTTALSVVNAEAAGIDGLVDGPLDVVWSLGEGGPHPLNDIDSYDRRSDIGFATYDIPADDQFGARVPIDGESPDGEIFMSIGFETDEGVLFGPGLYIDEMEDALPDESPKGEINAIQIEFGGERVIPREPKVTVVEVTDDEICGQITMVTETDLQTFMAIEGTFAVPREQALAEK